MKILVLGAGGVGGYFGARLLEAGANLSFLVRPRRAEQLARDGIVVQSPCGDLRLPAHAVQQHEVWPEYDLVILSCKAYDLESSMAAIAPAMHERTLILPLLNGVRHMEILQSRFGAERVLGGSCQIVVTLLPDGTILHMQDLHVLTAGALQPGQETALAEFRKACSGVKFKLRVSNDVMQDLWLKFTFLTTLAAMTCLMRSGISDIMSTEDGKVIVTETFDECVAITRAEGYTVPPAWYKETLERLTAPGEAMTASMLRDIERHGPVEADHIVGDMLRRSRAVKIPAPMLRVAYCHLQAYAVRRAREEYENVQKNTM